LSREPGAGNPPAFVGILGRHAGVAATPGVGERSGGAEERRSGGEEERAEDGVEERTETEESREHGAAIFLCRYHTSL